MTQTLDVHGSVTELRPRAAAASASAARTRSNRFGAFAVTFGIAFAIIYTVCEQMNWPLFTYHPAVGKLDFGMQPARRGEGPPMYWYGWLAISFAAAAVVGWIATMLSRRGLLRATVFCCVLAVLWPGLLMLAIFSADRVSFDAEFLKSPWISAVPAFVGAAAAAWFAPSVLAQRVWASWLLLMPIGGLVILGYSLKQYFLR
jgi:hypothetical protein